MSRDDQSRIVKDYDVFLERCYAQPMGASVDKSNLKDNLQIINEVGYKNVMVDTEEQIDFLIRKIPFMLLGLNK
ncbi:hypothetical protein [Tepidanaerobacter acetatoxydans]|nr:hypothetical protein [Tepidanaerobacter acetatoxydans]